jgi:hypothetical protein
MSKKNVDVQSVQPDSDIWRGQAEELKEEYRACTELTVEEKRFLDELETLPEENWEPVPSTGKPLSDTIIEERGAR